MTEFARVNGLVARAELTAEEGRSLLFATMDGSGFPPHLRAQMTEWFDSTLEAEAAATGTEQESEAEQPKEASPEQTQPAQQRPAQPARAAAPAPPAPAALDRETAQRVAYKYETLMRAAPNTPEWAAYWKNPQAQAEYRAAIDVTHGFVESSPTPPPTIAGGAAAPEQPAEPPQAEPARQPPAQPPPAPAVPAGPTRAQQQDRIAEIETKYMRATQGTPEYAAYWLGESGQRMQQEYRDLVTAREMPPAPAPPPTIASGAAAPQPGGDVPS